MIEMVKVGQSQVDGRGFEFLVSLEKTFEITEGVVTGGLILERAGVVNRMAFEIAAKLGSLS